MKNKLLFISFFILIGLVLLGQTSQSQNIESLLFEQLSKDKNTSMEDQITAALVLSDLVLSEQMFEQIRALNTAEDKNTNRFVQSYLLAKQTQELQYINQFISFFPEGETLTEFNSVLGNTSYKIADSPFQQALIGYAISSDKALKKLVRSIVSLDGANADAAQVFINDLYERTPRRVKNIFKQEEVTLSDYLYTEEDLANEETGVKNQEEEEDFAPHIHIGEHSHNSHDDHDDHDSHETTNLNSGKSGKPTSKDVIYLFMQNSDILLSEGQLCEGMGTKPEDTTVGDYISGFLAYHDPNYENETPFRYKSTPKGNYINVEVEQGRKSGIQEKHWQVTFQIGHYDLESNNIWKQGVSFIILDKDWVVLRDSFICIGAG